jgi:glycosyltransferase involved in cell wall biosynthesis
VSLPPDAQIAMLHYAGPPYVGGVELTIAAHARHLALRGHPVRILAGRGGELGEGIETVILPDLGSRGKEIERVGDELARGTASPLFEKLVQRIMGQLPAALAGASVLIVHNVVTLHMNLALTQALSRLIRDGALPPLVAWCHDFAWTDPLYARELHDGLPWDLTRKPWPGVRYVVVSADRQSTLAGLLGIASSDIAVVPPGIELAQFLKLEEATVDLMDRLDLLAADPLLLLPARITRRKNIELGLAITAALRLEGMDPRLVVTGPPDPHNPTNAAYMAALREEVKQLSAEPAVLFLYDELTDDQGARKPVSDAMMSDLFRLADALLFPSLAEGFGIPLLEASISAIPIFCSDIPVFWDVAPDAEVAFSPEDPPESIARRIAGVLRADPRYTRRRRVRTSGTWQTICDNQLIPLLDEVVSGEL